MTAKEYLQQIYIIHRKVRRLRARRDQIRDELYSIGSPSGKMNADRVQSSVSGDTMLKLIAKVDSIERGIVSEMNDMLELQEKIIRQINAVSNERQRDILYQRYVLFRKWEQIAVDMDVSVRYVYMVHGDALQSFARLHCIS